MQNKIRTFSDPAASLDIVPISSIVYYFLKSMSTFIAAFLTQPTLSLIPCNLSSVSTAILKVLFLIKYCPLPLSRF